ncbi:hypothetical protein Tco_0629083 [Tanacetum coccineum]|uniref:Uncharacterized protein n=1 Tax=Tanacetum coccineum TaxID=301880 RepID=A0ABQ4WS64_9ASTR
MIVETIHVNFDELPQMVSDHVSSDPGPQCSTTVLEQDSLSPGPQSPENVPQVAEIVTTSNELELLYSPMFSELLNGTSHVVSKSSAVHAADNPDKRQQHNTTHTSTTTDVADPPPLNIHSTHQTPTQVPIVTTPENIIQAETNAENAQFDDDEFINIFSLPVQEQGETSSRHVDSSNMHTFYQHHPSAQRWTKRHRLEQSHWKSSLNQLEQDVELLSFESIRFDEENTSFATNLIFVARDIAQKEELGFEESFAPVVGWKLFVCSFASVRNQQMDLLIPYHHDKSLPSQRKAIICLKQAPKRVLHDVLSIFLVSKDSLNVLLIQVEVSNRGLKRILERTVGENRASWSDKRILQVVYDVLKLTPFYKAFQVTADALEIYMQEFWASAYVHNRSVRFKMNNKKHILGLDQFRDILQICPKVGNKKFEEPPLEKEILAFLASLGHSGDIRKITDVNVNKLHQPWRSFAAIINKCLSGKPSYDSLRLSQAQILWGMYNKKNVDYAYLLWEDFIFQIENKNTKKGNAMYYPRFTKLVVNFVMDKDPSIPRRNKVNWHYARDDPMFTTINVISRNEDTQLYGAILPVALTNEDIRNSESYKEYYAIASRTIHPKTKGSKKKANTYTITKQKPPTAPKEKNSGKGKQKTTELETIFEADLTKAEQLKIITKRSRQETHSSHASGSGADEGTGVTPGVPDAPDYDSEDDISWKSSDDDQDDEQAQDDEDADKNDVNETTQDDEDDDDHDDDEKVQDDDEHDVDETVQEDDDEEQTESDDDGDDFVHPKLTTHDDDIIHEEETDEDDSFDPTIHTPSRISSSDDEDSDNEVEGTNVEGAKSDEEATYEEDQGNEAVEDTNTDLDGRDDVMTDVILPQVQATQEIEDTHVTLTPVNPDGQQQSSSVSSGFVSNMLNPNQDTGVDDIFGQHTEATSLIDTPVTAIMEPSFTAQTNRPPTPNPLVIQNNNHQL